MQAVIPPLLQVLCMKAPNMLSHMDICNLYTS